MLYFFEKKWQFWTWWQTAGVLSACVLENSQVIDVCGWLGLYRTIQTAVQLCFNNMLAKLITWNPNHRNDFLMSRWSFWSKSRIYIYRISANSFRENYSFLELGVRKLFKGGKYSREETIVFLLFLLHKKTWIMVAVFSLYFRVSFFSIISRYTSIAHDQYMVWYSLWRRSHLNKSVYHKQ